MSEKIVIGGIYRHYEGRPQESYRVIHIACGRGSLSGKDYVVYEQLYDVPDHPRGTVHIRTLEEFAGEVEIGGKKVKRFTLVE